MSTTDKIETLKKKLSGDIDPSAKNLKDAVDAASTDKFPYKNMVSPSMFERFTECPKQWELRYKEKLYEPEDNENTIYGDSIHRLVENYMESNSKEEYQDEERLEEIVSDAVVESAKDVKDRWDGDASENREIPYTPQVIQEMIEDATRSFGQFIEFEKKFFTNGLDLISVEEEFKGPIFHNLEFRGKVDLILYNKETEEFYVIDIKSSDQSWENADINFRAKKVQLLSYKFYFSKNVEVPLENIKTAFVVLNREGDANGEYNYVESVPIDSSNEKISWMLNQWRDFLKAVTSKKGYYLDQSYKKKPSEKYCKRCPYSTEFNGTKTCDQGGKRFNEPKEERW